MARKTKHIDVEIDKLTNSIENILTGEVFDTQIVRLTIKDIKQIRRKDWLFDWISEIRDASKEIYKLTTLNNPNIIHGLISLEDKKDHIFMHLVESSHFNKGKTKIYLGVPANLVSFACKVSFEKGYQGYVAFDSKSSLIEHYKKTLGATHIGGQRMYIETTQAWKLVIQYFKT